MIPGTDKPGQREPQIQDSPTPPSPPPHVKHNAMSKECLLYSAKEATAVKKYLDQKNLTYIPTDPSIGDCFYESILTGFGTFCEEKGKLYTGSDLRLQLCHFMLKFPEMCRDLLIDRLISFNTSLYHYVRRLMKPKEWGEAWLLHILYAMWNLNSTVIDVTMSGHLIHYGSKDHASLETADIVIIYNGDDHYSGTGIF